MERKTRILFEETAEGVMSTEVSGRLDDLLNILLTGIEHMFDEPIERDLFKLGIRRVYQNWNAAEREEEDD